MDEEHPLVDAMAVEGACITSVGDTPTLRNSHPDANVVNLEGNTVMPGIIESHGHSAERRTGPGYAPHTGNDSFTV